MLHAALSPPGEARPDCWIIQQVARAMGLDGFDQPDEAAIYAEHAALTAGRDCDVSGVTHARLRGGSLQWPVPHASHPGTPRLFAERFAQAAGERMRQRRCVLRRGQPALHRSSLPCPPTNKTPPRTLR